MSDYIETDTRCNCGCSGNNDTEFNPPYDNDTPGSGEVPTPTTEDWKINIDRWRWIEQWPNFSFKEKFSLILPKVVHIKINYVKTDDEASDYINEKITETVFEECRSIQSIRFDTDRNGGPNILIVLNPIDHKDIPHEFKEIADSIKHWKTLYGHHVRM